jgi:trans-aconitate 2-methyltransferase
VTTTVWDPAQYERYKAYRDRPALDLMVQIPFGLQPREIWDIGCGTGEHAALLKRRHPDARVHGLDASPEMLAQARARPDDVDWVQGSFETWTAPTPPDLIFTNAALQWSADNKVQVPRLAGALASGGVFACQVPLSHSAPWYDLLRETIAEPEWAARLAQARGTQPIATPETYYDLLAPLCSSVDIWTTTYLHALSGEDPVVDWMKGTGLRPYLQALSSETERGRFLDAYRARVSRAFPRRADGTTLFPFPRLFVLARRA